ncbi:MAG: hypothetical protein U5K76_16025 [Woeseiaceae bacterium]|nr:hypothetical protein [Woeseiaceae bacterium]
MMNTQLKNWRPQLRRAVMKTRPEFFAWPRDRQERWGVAMPAEDRAHFDEALLAELFHRPFATRAEAIAAIDRLSLDELNIWNETVLPLHGIGEDCFYLNEIFADDESILEFETVRDYDENDFRFQENARRKDDPGYTGRPYRGSLYLTWARLFVDGRFTYATLSTAAGYLYAGLEDAASEFIEQRIPHRYVPGKSHGKVQGECWQWDMRLDANGEEGILEELQRRVWRYELDRWDALLTRYDESDSLGVYLFDDSAHGETRIHFVFTDKRALSVVRFRSFLRDCRRIERPANEIECDLETERAALADFVESQLAEIRRTYDPKVPRFAKRSKVMVRKDAFD